jgi:hypothetical protein
MGPFHGADELTEIRSDDGQCRCLRQCAKRTAEPPNRSAPGPFIPPNDRRSIRDLSLMGFWLCSSDMKFIASLAFFLVTTAVLSAGIACTASGKVYGPYLLLGGTAIFGGLFVKFGCLDQH